MTANQGGQKNHNEITTAVLICNAFYWCKNDKIPIFHYPKTYEVNVQDPKLGEGELARVHMVIQNNPNKDMPNF